jgi:hypothetical protein
MFLENVPLWELELQFANPEFHFANFIQLKMHLKGDEVLSAFAWYKKCIC